MRPGLQQSTGLRQELKVNPRLYQAMDLLHMPLLDLQQHLKQELLTNPFLDLVEPEDEDEESADADDVPEAQDMAEPETAVESEPEKTGDDEVDWEAVLLDGFETGGQREESEQREWYEPVTVDTKHLSDHLTEQLSLIEMSPREAILADDFVGNISDDGYLACPLEVIQRGMNEWLEAEAAERDAEVTPFSDDDMQSMLTIIQELDPPGVGARDLRECLMLQLRAAGQRDSTAYQLVEESFEELIAHRWSELSKRFGISAQDVQRAADEIAKLEVDVVALEMLVLRVLSAEKSGKQTLDIAGLLKIRGSEIQQRYSELMMLAAGPASLPFIEEAMQAGWQGDVALNSLWLGGTPHNAPLASTYFNMRKTTIYGGSNEVQRNIVAQTVLG